MHKGSGVRKRYCQKDLTLTRSLREESARIRANVNIVKKKKIDIAEAVP